MLQLADGSVPAALTGCDREPIATPGSIQPHGVLLAIDPRTLTIVQVAGDTQSLLGTTSESLFGQGIEAKLGPIVLDRIQSLLREYQDLPLPLLISEARFAAVGVTVTASTSGGLLLLELERAASPDATPNAIELVQTMTSELQAINDLDPLLQTIVVQVQTITGYDRVMVYRFEPDDSGQVVAEHRSRDGVDSFLNLHFPASDIPAQARALYRRNWIRCIPDVTCQPAFIEPANNPLTGEHLDLSDCSLRSVSPLHLEYLMNMGVSASMSLSIIIEGRLWGLIACHHGQIRYLDYRVRVACELFAQLASMQLQTVRDAEQARRRVRTREVHDGLVQAMSRAPLAEALPRHHPNLLDLVPASGVAVRVDGVTTLFGTTPDHQEVQGLIDWLRANIEDGVYTTDRLSEVYAPASAYADRASGLLVLSISHEASDLILWFLPEQVQVVTWAGNPEKPVQSGPHGDRLTPRKSFAAWTNTVRRRSRRWEAFEIEAAQLMRVSLLETVLGRLDELKRERNLAKSHQDLLRAELDHQADNIVVTIQALTRFSGRCDTNLNGLIDPVERRLQSIAKAHNLLTRSRWIGASIRDLVENELMAHRPVDSPALHLQGDFHAVDTSAALSLSLALHELATNAAKYGALSVPAGRLAVTWSAAQRDGDRVLALAWIETGGPVVTTPSHCGFGRTLLERVFATEVNGRLTLDFAPSGLICAIDIPFTHVVTANGRPAGNSVAPSRLCDLRVLIVEDRAPIAHSLAHLLRQEGSQVVGMCHTLEDAMVAVGQHDFDVCLLDIDLNGSLVWPLASLLDSRKKRFVLTTDVSDELARLDGFDGIPVVTKPYDRAPLVAALASAGAIAPQNAG